ncbi:MAG: N-acetylneuraminate synthase family protein [Candidatus Omnitrophica bacterium]|nr:N-acetylneuraminate synthase family protein [Candidatus Omnitrophota bacterium]
MEFAISERRKIGGAHPVFIIAEVGNNHQGDFNVARQSVDCAADVHADAVTFQHTPLRSYCVHTLHDDPRIALLKQCELSFEQLQKLRMRAKEKGLAFSVNVENAEMLDKVLKLGIDFIKLCSADLTNTPFIKYCASQQKPIFFSTGGAYIEEIQVAYDAMKKAGLRHYVIYHTNSGYPTPMSEANIRQMDLLHDRFGGVKGYCDHTGDIIPPIVAVSRGAKVIEKHITVCRASKGIDWMVSLEPQEFERMVTYIRQAESSLGSIVKEPTRFETETRLFKRKSIISKTNIPAGKIFSEEDFCYKLPSTGISPVDVDKVVGRKSLVDIAEDVVILPTYVEGFK